MSDPGRDRVWLDLLACPICKGPLECDDTGCTCTGGDCGASFPRIAGAPILINESRSLFSIADFVEKKTTTFNEATPGAGVEPKRRLRRLIPSNSRAVRHGAEARFLESLQGESRHILVIGCGDRIYPPQTHQGELIYSDVNLGAGVDLIADTHDLPFRDGTIDGIIAISVMEHLVDPQRSAEEIARVLKPSGRLLAASPFMQQVHLGRYDFTRFTHLGHRRLWRHFDEIESGVDCGPGMALAWAWQYFLLSFSERPQRRKYLRALAKLTSFPLPYFDELLKRKAGAFDAGSSYYFVGEKREAPISDREIVAGYRGLENL
jgi:SAM-dependent methyltransferase/uncharacterized protein YbaR (Trm112 family)